MSKNKIYIKEKYTKDVLVPLVKESITYTEVCRKLGIFSTGSGWRYIKDKIIEHNIDTSHFLGQSSFAGKRNPHIQRITAPKEKILVLRTDGIKTSSSVLRRAMIESDVEHKCYSCKINKWCEKNIVLKIHHIDGNNINNILSNLQFLCPNCHSQTNNFGAKNKIKMIKML